MRVRLIIHLLLITTAFFFSQCTIQKRVYQKGWYVDFHQSLKPQLPVSESQQVKSIESNVPIVRQDLKAEFIPEPLEKNELIELEELDSMHILSAVIPFERSEERKWILPKEVKESQANSNKSIQKKPNPDRYYWSIRTKTATILVFLALVIVGSIFLFIGLATLTSLVEIAFAIVGIVLLYFAVAILLFVMLAIPSQESVERAEERKRQRAVEQKNQEEAEKIEQDRLEELPKEEREQELEKISESTKAKSKENRNNSLIVLTIAGILVALFVILNKVNG